jgi:peptide/nickel transport system substrate-binding protein
MHRSRTTAFAVAAALIAALVSTAGASATRSSVGVIPTLRVGLVNSHAGTLDDTKDSTFGAIYIADLGLENLTVFTPSGKVRPWLATSVTQPGRAVYVYHLRHGVKFWDGNELTADDVANSLNYERYPSSQAHSFGFPSVKSVIAKDKYTVVITLRHADPSWLSESSLYGWNNVFEKKFQLAHKATYGQPGTLVMGTGAWKIDSFDPTSGAELSANPHWWGGKVPIQHITIKFFADENSMALAFRAGDIDVAGGSGLGDPRAFAGTAGTKLLTGPSFNEVFLSMNTGGGGPWGDVHVRRAVSYALNRTGLIGAIGGSGYATPVSTLILPIQLGTIASQAQVQALLKSLPQYPFSLAKAKAEMAKSAYPHGFSGELMAPDYWNLQLVGQAFAGAVKPLGINLTVTTPGTGAWFGALVGPAAKRPLNVGGFGALGPDASGWDVIFKSKDIEQGQENFANYVRPEVDALIKQEESMTNPAKRIPIFKKLLTIYANDVPYLPFYSPDLSTAVSSRFTWPTYGAYTANSGVWPFEIKQK